MRCKYKVNICCLCIVCMCCFLCIGKMSAQNKIEGFYGLKLGMSKSEVISILRSKSINYKIEDSAFIIHNVTFANQSFESLYLGFKNSKLRVGTFRCSDNRVGDPNGFFFNEMSQRARQYRGVFDQMYSIFLSKYGTPQISNDNQYVWINKNQISLEYEFEDNMESPYTRLVRTAVYVIYKLIDNNSTDY